MSPEDGQNGSSTAKGAASVAQVSRRNAPERDRRRQPVRRRGGLAALLLGVGSAMAVGSLAGCATTETRQASKARTYELMRYARPADADAFSAVLIARYAALNNDPAEAMRRYAEALDSVPEGDGLATRGVFAALMSGDFDQAAIFARHAQAGGTGSSLTSLTLAVDALTSSQTAEAATHIASGAYGPFSRSMATSLAAWLAYEAEGLDAATAYLDASVAEGTMLASVAWTMAGLMQLSAGDDEAAFETFSKIDAVGPRLALATDARARLLATRGEVDTARAYLADFRREIGVHPALTALDRQLAAGEDITVPRLDAREGAALGLYAPAAALAARSQSDFPAVYFVLALQLDPTLDAARTLWADALDRSGRREDAMSVLAGVPFNSVYYPTAQGQLAWVQLRDGRPDTALETARAALASAPDRDLKVQLADLLIAMARDVDAITLLDDVIETDIATGAEDWRILFARGAARDRSGDWTGAEADLSRALALAPDNADIMSQLAVGWVDQQRNTGRALVLLERATRLKPNDGRIRDSLGWALSQLGRYQEGVVHLERAVELDPTDAQANEHLGDAYWRLGRELEATFQWERALALVEVPSEAQALSRKLVAGLPPRTGGLVGASLMPADPTMAQP